MIGAVRPWQPLCTASATGRTMPLIDIDHEPTFDDVIALAPGDYFQYNNHTWVKGMYVGVKSIEFECPFCFSSHNQDGSPRANARRIVHCFGDSGSSGRALLSRTAHCIRGNTTPFMIAVEYE